MADLKKELSLEKIEKVADVLKDLERDLKEIDEMRKRVKEKHISFLSPQENKKLLEELEVPSLELLREEPVFAKKKK